MYLSTAFFSRKVPDEKVSSWVRLCAQLAHCVIFWVSIGHQLVEDVVISLDLELEGDTGLLQKVSLDIGGGDLARGAEVDTDEFTLN